jgi:hypothetical protein
MVNIFFGDTVLFKKLTVVMYSVFLCRNLAVPAGLFLFNTLAYLKRNFWKLKGFINRDRYIGSYTTGPDVLSDCTWDEKFIKRKNILFLYQSQH